LPFYSHNLIITEDGSHTLYVPELNETYHSKFGAIQESTCVFIENGLNHLIDKQEQIDILEIGFGTGLNALLTFIQSQKFGTQINYTSLEIYPLPFELVLTLNYTTVLNTPQLQDLYLSLHQLPSNANHMISNNFSFTKKELNVEDFKANQCFDLIFFDAFAPEINANLWTENVLENMFLALRTNGILTTYCAKGAFKRTLKNIGFQITNPPGPKGKREITTAFKHEKN
jgi:tRNA U34 5-methylaminomethyl-2-thiouridine-forming methyltransferase MnmC